MPSKILIPLTCLFFSSVAVPGPLFSSVSAGRSLDVVLALDNSGSMKKNDPNSLMRRAVSGFALSLAPESRLGIVLFDQNVHSVLDLLSAGNPTFRSRVGDSLGVLDYRGRWTDIPGGVERSIYALRQSGRPDAQRIIVLFTDGIIETGNPARDVERSRWLRENLAFDAKRLGMRIFGVAFTETADYQLMQSLAEVTGGEYYRVLSASDIPSTFARIGARLRNLDQRPSPPSPPAPPFWQHLLRWPYLVGGGFAVVVLVAIVWLLGKRYPAASERPTILAHLRDLGGSTGNEVLPLDRLAISIGRDGGSNDMTISQDTVSTKHARIEFRDGAFHLRDLRSANGSFLNGKQFSDPNEMREVILKHGDKLRFDAFEFEFVEDALEGVQQTRLAGNEEGFGSRAGGTRLRGEPPVAEYRSPEPVVPAPTIHKPQEIGAAGLEGNATRLKPDMCPHHPAWKATDLCPICRIPKCKSCMTQKDGSPICAKCATDQAA